tara:strand:+ start:610 stop:3087 length:2478 start_codon:yes stop_codon:yes gene_type:complete
MSIEICESFCGTCHLMVEYYKAIKKNVNYHKLNRSKKRLTSFIKEMKKAGPLIRRSGKITKKERDEITQVMNQVHGYVIDELNNWMKKSHSYDILKYLHKKIDYYKAIITNINNMNTETSSKKNLKRSHNRKLKEKDREESDEYESSVFETEEDSDEDYTDDEDALLYDSSSGDDYDSEEDDYDSEEDESEEDESEEESEDDTRKKKQRRTSEKNGVGSSTENINLKKLREYLMRRDKRPYSSVKSQLESFKTLPKEHQKKIIEQINNKKDNCVSCPLMYRIMLSNIPQVCKNDMIERLESLDKNEDECPKYREYVNAALRIPFGVFIQSKVNCKSKQKDIKKFLKDTSKCMDNAVHGHEQAKQQILQFVAQNISNPTPKGLVLGIEGPMGNGKTTLIEKGFSKALGRPFSTIPLGGVQDGSFLEGHGYTYEGSRWGQIVTVLMNSKCMNPIIYMDELDKVSRTAKGDEINNLLIHLIDPSQNHHFRDKYFSDMNIDLSQAIFIFSYNDRDAINPVLMDRITHLKTRGFRLPEKVIISKKFLLKNILSDVGLNINNIEFKDDVLEWIIQNYTHEGGVRKLKKICYEIVRELNLRRLTNKSEYKFPYVVTRKILESDILSSHIPFRHDTIHEKPVVGKINGLYATCNDTGGITLIETVWLPSDQNLKLELTGSQGKVMQESMHVGKTLSWSLLTDADKEKLKNKWNKEGSQGIHVHCPEGATPKDGPSAGAAITTAMYSLLSGKKIRNDIAITGEIDLSGKILEIGGLESKIYGAKAAGCKKVLCPSQNEKALKKILKEHPEIISDSFQVKTVSTIQEVLNIMLKK